MHEQVGQVVRTTQVLRNTMCTMYFRRHRCPIQPEKYADVDIMFGSHQPHALSPVFRINQQLKNIVDTISFLPSSSPSYCNRDNRPTDNANIEAFHPTSGIEIHTSTLPSAGPVSCPHEKHNGEPTMSVVWLNQCKNVE